MKEYHKIETVYERDVNGTKKLIEGKFRSETVEFLAGNRWVFTEKIDGTNIRVHWDGHIITFGGRTDKADIPKPLLNRLQDIFLNDETEQLFEQIFGEKEVIFFGEGYGTKIQKVGSRYRSGVDFILFDVMVNSTYLNRNNVEKIATTFGLDLVPIVLTGTIEEAVKFVKSKPRSKIATDDLEMEGVVGHPEVELLDHNGHRVIVKIKSRDFN